MITDSQTTFSNNQTIAATGSTDSANFIDLSAPRDIGSGEELKLYLAVTTSFTQTGTGSVVANLVADTSATFGNSPEVVNSTTIAVANMLVGAEIPIQIVSLEPYQGERYLKMQYVVQGTTLTSGAVSAGLVLDAPADEYYPRGDNVVGV